MLPPSSFIPLPTTSKLNLYFIIWIVLDIFVYSKEVGSLTVALVVAHFFLSKIGYPKEQQTSVTQPANDCVAQPQLKQKNAVQKDQ
jgi:hypothetical protein